MEHYSYQERMAQGHELCSEMIQNRLVSARAKEFLDGTDAQIIGEDYWEMYKTDGINAVVANIENMLAEYDSHIWYAVQETDDDEWGYGTHDWDEAVEMLKKQGHGLIATINEETNVCEDETYYEDIFC